MSYERLIAKRFLQRDSSNLSRPLVKIAVASIAMAVLVMVMAVSILRGFQHNIEQKVVGFGSHVTVRSQEVGHYYEEVPIRSSRADLQALARLPGVRHVQGVAQKGGMVKTDGQIQGVVVKGVGGDYDTTFLRANLVAGALPAFLHARDSAASNEILLSQSLAKKLGLAVGDKVRTYFWTDNSCRARAFTLCGLFCTDMPELDDHYAVADLRQVQALNGWAPDQVACCEVTLDDFGQLDAMADQLYHAIGYDLTLSTIVEDNTSLFAWLNLLNSNIILILTVMAVVCIVAIISALLIMIFEKTQMIGILKTLGATNGEVRKIFLLKTLRIAGSAIAIGCAVALALSAVQARWHLLKLNSESYSMSYVPVEIDPTVYLAVAAGTLLVCLLSMLLPAAYITRIEPAKTIRFE